MALTIASREVDGVTVLDLSGRITLGEGSVQLRDAIRDLISKGQKKILLNLGDVNYIDSSGLGEMVSAYTTARNQGATLKLLKMTNVVSDSQGDIFTTKKGELRLVLDRKKPSWFTGKAETELISLPLEENRIMIYTDLGVYAGQRLGTPCDDLL